MLQNSNASVFFDLINFASNKSTTYVSVEEGGYFELGTVENPMNLEATVYIKFRATNVLFSLNFFDKPRTYNSVPF